jgi:Rad3-related DNA helicase
VAVVAPGAALQYVPTSCHALACCLRNCLTSSAGVLLLQVCPYYGSRRAVPAVDVILAPYSSVLLPDARDSLGIELQGSVVVFDEAHNLLDAINGAHSTAVSGGRSLMCRVDKAALAPGTE